MFYVGLPVRLVFELCSFCLFSWSMMMLADPSTLFGEEAQQVRDRFICQPFGSFFFVL